MRKVRPKVTGKASSIRKNGKTLVGTVSPFNYGKRKKISINNTIFLKEESSCNSNSNILAC